VTEANSLAEAHLASLREYLELLAADASTQIAWLRAERYPADEMLLQLDDAIYSWFPRLEESGLLTPAAKASVLSLREFMDALNEPELWRSPDALASAAEWRETRARAQAALELLGAPKEPRAS
jgi:hypothetical protein